jgi:DNA-directed RNA polymerase specialized sigma24 family protein
MMTSTIKAPDKQELFIHAYKTAFPKVASFVRKMGGSFDEARDIFQDALVIYYEKKVLAGLTTDNEAQYISGIARHLWYRKFHKEKRFDPLPDHPDLQSTEDEPRVSESILRVVEHSGKKCLELLKAFYYDRLNMKEIAVAFGFSGERSATTQKFKCLEKVRDTIKERSLNKEDFYE